MDTTEVKRRYLRKDVGTGVQFILDGETRSCLSVSIGEGGLYAQSVIPPPLGSRMNLEFDLPTGLKIKVTGEVRHVLQNNYGSLPAGFGVQFLDLSEADRQAIVDWVESEG